ncbi:Fibrillin-3 [Geodia barretti]|uniref:Fibrillin-3 n=1 Tax=Geodia barretti TaxID=519541 RepID=A0AA35U0F4_GEOBA|nr:Fibrillin-3 [Geodia barretti]
MGFAALICLQGLLFSMFSLGSTVSSIVGSTTSSSSIIANRQGPTEGRVYLNLNNGARTSGTVYSWTYCYSADGDPPPYELVIAMYRPQPNGTYQLIPGSYRELRITTRLGSTFDCRDIDLDTSDFFKVQPNDVVGVCEPFNSRRVEIFFSAPGSFLSWNAGSCSEDRISSSRSSLAESQRIFLLRASINVNECAEGTHTCHENAQCTDVVGGFTCECSTGFTGDDIDECSSDYSPCHEQATCSNEVGNFSCECNTGFTGDGFHCEDIDECLIIDGGSTCHEQATCSNKPGGYTCTCNTGFTGNGSFCEGTGAQTQSGTSAVTPIVLITAGASSVVTFFVSVMATLICVKLWQMKKRDIDLDTSDFFKVQPNDVVGVCEPFDSGRVEIFFSAPDTFLSWDAGSCREDRISSSRSSLAESQGTIFLLRASINVNECAEGTHTCHENAKCTDVVGGFTCECSTGFTGDGFVCQDIDECSSDYSSCHEQATCSNEVGNFSCECNTGFTGDGFHCEGTGAQTQSGTSAVTLIVLITAGASSVVTFFVSVMATLTCVKLWQMKKRHELSEPVAPASGGVDIISKPCLAYGSLDTEKEAKDGQNEEYYSYAN